MKKRNYYGEKTQSEGPLTGAEMRVLFDELSEIIKKNIPHAMIAWDASLWITQADMSLWWSYFKDSKHVNFVYTSSSHLRNSLPLKFINELTQKLIIVESGIILLFFKMMNI